MELMRGARKNILDAVGNTPLVKLNHIGAHTKADIYVKCEFLNPGGSMKDRIAINIIRDAEEKGLLKPGGVIVEATSGNTGMGLAICAAVRGYRTIFVMPDKMSDEKIRALRAVGARVVVCPTDVEPADPRSYYCVSRRIADETPNAFYANQYHNPANPDAHYRTTGPEIWEQTGGEFDVFCAGMGTGGTLSGSGKYFRERNPKVQIVGVDPIGSIYYEYFKTGRMTEAHPYKVEGIGEDFLPSTMNLKILDDIVRVNDKECFVAARDLVRREGILCGGSGGAAVAGAVRYAEQHDRPMRIIAHLPDSALRYLTKYLDDDWMRENGLLGPEPGFGTAADILRLISPTPRKVLTASAGDPIFEIITRMRHNNISQLPIVDDGEIMGMVTEKDLLSILVQGEVKLDSPIGPHVASNVAKVQPDTPVGSLHNLFNKHTAVVVVSNGDIAGVITKIDLIDYMAAKLT